MSLFLAFAALAPSVSDPVARTLPEVVVFSSDASLAQRLASSAGATLGATEFDGGNARDGGNALDGGNARETGRLRSLRGAPHELAADDLHAADVYVRSLADALGVPTDLELAFTRRGEARPRLDGRFSLDGAPVLGASVALELDSLGRVVATHARGFASSARLGERELDDGAAPSVALGVAPSVAPSVAPGAALAAAAKASAPSLPSGEFEPVGAPRPAWRSTRDGLVPVTLVTIVSRDGWQAYEVELDARSAAGEVRDTRSLVRHGVGLYPAFGDQVVFKTGTAKARAFKNVAASLSGKDKKQSLKHWSLGVAAPGDVPKGALLTARAEVHDHGGADVFSVDGKFLAAANEPADALAFDQANVVFQIERTFGELAKLLGEKPACDVALPAVTNAPSPSPQGAFVAAPFDGGRVTGFLRFSNHGAEARDATLIAHEYVHGWLFHEGQSFDANSFHPFSAFEEGLADWLGTTLHKRTAFGELLAQEFGGLFLRDLEGETTFDDAYLAATGGSFAAFAEFRALSAVVRETLFDFERVLGRKTMVRLVHRALPDMPKDLADLGLSSLSANEAYAVSRQAFAACLGALVDRRVEDEPQDYAELLGSVASRGLSDELTQFSPIELFELPKPRLRIVVTKLDGQAIESFDLRLPVGVTLRVHVEGVDVDESPSFGMIGSFQVLSNVPDADGNGAEVVVSTKSGQSVGLRVSVGEFAAQQSARYELELELLD
ncbi:MAG: hypothetical protein L6Q99_20040 [Planctomycetes bacterium]|nr:hypothetical protein [Planctomycetota bacterium]